MLLEEQLDRQELSSGKCVAFATLNGDGVITMAQGP